MPLEAANKRLGGALVASLMVNTLLWGALGSVLSRQKSQPPILEFSRVVLTPQGKPQTKNITPQQVARRVAGIRRLAPPKRLVRPLNTINRPHQIQPKSPRPASPVEAAPRDQSTQQKSQGARKFDSLDKPAPDAGEIKPAGKSEPGQSSDTPNFGNQKTNSPIQQRPSSNQEATQPSAEGTPVASATQQAPTPAPPPTEPTSTPVPTATPTPVPTPTPRPTPTPEPTPTPRPTATPRPEPTNTPRPEPTNTPRPRPTATPRPEPTNTPRPKGKSRPARYSPPVPVLPGELKLRDSVRARVTIEVDGSVSATLLGSSGDAGADATILRALERSRGKPKLRDGEPVASTVTVEVRIPPS